MKYRPISIAAFFLLILTLVSATAAPPQSTPPSVQALDDIKGRYIRMAHNFFILYDPATTRDVPYKETGMPRIEAQKYILQKSNASLPQLNRRVTIVSSRSALI